MKFGHLKINGFIWIPYPIEQNKPFSERQISHVLPNKWNLKKDNMKVKGGYY